MDLRKVFHTAVDFICLIDRVHARTVSLLLVDDKGNVLCDYNAVKGKYDDVFPATSPDRPRYRHKPDAKNAVAGAMRTQRLCIVGPKEHDSPSLRGYWSVAVPLRENGVVVGYLSGLLRSDIEPEMGQALFSAYGKFFEAELVRQRASEQLEGQVNILNTVLKALPFGCIVVDREGCVLYANEQAEFYSGVPVQEMTGSHMRDLFFSEDVLSEIFEDGNAIVDQEVFLKQQGSGQSIQAVRTAMPVPGEDGSTVAVVDMLREMRNVKATVNRFSGNQAQYHFSDIIYRSAAMAQVIAVAKNVAFNHHPVLIESESGTGKELLAQAIHNASPRKNGPFVVLDCSSIPKDLAESELFGYVSGAFTGATKGGKLGKAELASGGTLFLDEIGELPLQLQIKLLRFLQTKTFTRVGDTKPISSNARIIAATNRDLRQEIEKNNFRLDLYFRLNVFLLRLPPLRERREDIPVLAKAFLHRYEREFGKTGVTLSPEAERCMLEYPWPGNVRELENYMIRCLAICQDTVLPLHLPFSDGEGAVSAVPDRQPKTAPDGAAGIREALERCGGNVSKAAAQLGISRQTLYGKMAALGIETPPKPSRQALTPRSVAAALRTTGGNRSAAAKLLGISRKTLYEKLKEFDLA